MIEVLLLFVLSGLFLIGAVLCVRSIHLMAHFRSGSSYSNILLCGRTMRSLIMLLVIIPALATGQPGITRKSFNMVISPLITTQTSAEEAAYELELDLASEHTPVFRYELERYEAAISKLQSDIGVYAPNIAEIRLDMASAYLAAGQYEEAVEALSESIHITKVNRGLYSTAQIPAIEMSIVVNEAMGDWNAVVKNYTTLIWIHKRNQNDIKALNNLNGFVKRQIWAYHQRAGGKRFEHLLNAADAYKTAVKILSQQPSVNLKLFSELVYGSASLNYWISAHAYGPEPMDEVFDMSGSTSGYENLIAMERARQRLVKNGYIQGKKALEGLVRACGPDMDKQRATALVYLGDWYLLFNKRNTAIDHYKKASKLLESEESDRLFKKPLLLPASLNDVPLTGYEPYLKITLDVSEWGKPENVEIIQAMPDDNTRFRNKAMKSFNQLQFRPQLVAGVPVRTEELELKIIFRGKYL